MKTAEETPAETIPVTPVAPSSAVGTSVDSPPAPQRSSPGPRWATLWMTDRDVAAFAVILAVVFALLVVRYGQVSGWGAAEIEIDRLSPLEYEYKLDLNAASWVEFAQLDGVGQTLALRIVEDRETRGSFHSVDDLDRVKGVGEKTVERLRPFLKVESGRPAAASSLTN